MLLYSLSELSSTNLLIALKTAYKIAISPKQKTAKAIIQAVLLLINNKTSPAIEQSEAKRHKQARCRFSRNYKLSL